MAPGVAKDLYFSRPGEEARMLARCQFRIDKLGNCTATFTYPKKGLSWRRNTIKTYAFDLDEPLRAVLFNEVERLRRDAPDECLGDAMLWSDTSEIANAITRDRKSGKLCVEIAVVKQGGEVTQRYSMREDSPALLSSILYKTISSLIQPYEKI